MRLIEPHGEQSMPSTAIEFALAGHLSAKACSPSYKIFSEDLASGHSDTLACGLGSNGYAGSASLAKAAATPSRGQWTSLQITQQNARERGRLQITGQQVEHWA